MESYPRIKFTIAAIGIFVSYFCFGILQEQITRKNDYGGEKFIFIPTLVFVQCLWYTIFARGEKQIKMKTKINESE